MPTPGASSASANDKIAGSFIDNGDGSYEQMTSTVAQNPNNQWASIPGVGTVTAPASGAQIAAATAGQTGYYDITAEYGYGATSEITTPDNFTIVLNSTVLTKLPAPTGPTNTLFPPVSIKRKLSAGDNVYISVDGTAGSSGSVYKGFITLTRTA